MSICFSIQPSLSDVLETQLNNMDEQEKCDYFDCPFCHWGCCTGDKDFAIEMNLCRKETEDDT